MIMVWIEEHLPARRKFLLVYNKKTKRVRKHVPSGCPYELAQMGASVVPFTPAYDAVMKKMARYLDNRKVFHSAIIKNGFYY